MCFKHQQAQGMGTSRKLIFIEGMPPHLMLRLRNKKLVNELTKDQLALLFPEVCWWKDQCSTASREGSCSPGADQLLVQSSVMAVNGSDGPSGVAGGDSPQGRHLVALILRIATAELLLVQVELAVL